VRVTHLSFTNVPFTATKKDILIQLTIEYGDPLENTNSFWSPYAVPGKPAYTNDSQAVELAIRFTSDVAGFIRGIRFYKGTTNTGTHTGHLWRISDSSLLGTLTFTNETVSGWQEGFFATPIPITAGISYLASYHAPNGNYAIDEYYFNTQGIDKPPLHAPGNPTINGRYRYTSTGPFPDLPFKFSNYWVDVIFSTIL
jgi:hypothetical protein